jgi:hypothetical protein
VNIQLKSITPNALSPPKPIVLCHVFDQRNDLSRHLWFIRSGFRLVLPEKTKALTVPAQKGLWLDNQEGLSPGPRRSCQKHQEASIPLGAYWSFALSTKNDELLA